MNEETENELLKGSQERGEGSEVFMRWNLISEVENLGGGGGEKGMGEVDVQSHHTHARTRTHTHTHITHITHTHTILTVVCSR